MPPQLLSIKDKVARDEGHEPDPTHSLKAARLHKISTSSAYFLASWGWSGVGVGVSRSRLGALAALGGRAAAAAAEADSLCSMG